MAPVLLLTTSLMLSPAILFEELPDHIDRKLILALTRPIMTAIPTTVYDFSAGGKDPIEIHAEAGLELIEEGGDEFHIVVAGTPVAFAWLAALGRRRIVIGLVGTDRTFGPWRVVGSSEERGGEKQTLTGPLRP
jgi:hypothetical protein